MTPYHDILLRMVRALISDPPGVSDMWDSDDVAAASLVFAMGMLTGLHAPAYARELCGGAQMLMNGKGLGEADVEEMVGYFPLPAWN